MADKSKIFYVTDEAEAYQHKPSKKNVIGFGLLNSLQIIILYTSHGRALEVSFDELKIGSRKPQLLFMLDKGEKIDMLDIRMKV